MKTTVFCENFCLVQKVKGRENEAGVGEASSLFVALALVWARPAWMPWDWKAFRTARTFAMRNNSEQRN